MPIRSPISIAKGKLRRSGFANEVPNRQKVRQKIRQKVGQKGNFMERDYEEIFQKVLDYEQTLHEKNRKRIIFKIFN